MLLEGDCHKLDLLLASQSQGEMVGAGPSFEDYVALIRERQELRERVESLEKESDELEGLLVWSSMYLPNAEYREDLEILKKEVIKKRKEKEKVVRHLSCIQNKTQNTQIR